MYTKSGTLTGRFSLINLLHGLWNPEVQCHQGLSNNSCPGPIQADSSYWHLFLQNLFLHCPNFHWAGFLRGLLRGGLPDNISKELQFSVRPVLAACPGHLNPLDLITVTVLGERYKLWSYFLRSILHSPLLYNLGPDIHLRILISKYGGLHFFLDARDDDLQRYNTTGNIVIYIPLELQPIEGQVLPNDCWLTFTCPQTGTKDHSAS